MYKAASCFNKAVLSSIELIMNNLNTSDWPFTPSTDTSVIGYNASIARAHTQIRLGTEYELHFASFLGFYFS